MRGGTCDSESLSSGQISARVSAGPQAPLETIAKSVGHSDGRAARFRHQRHAAALLGGTHRVGLCRFSVISKQAGVNLVTSRYGDGSDHAHYEGVQTCGSVWACPCCSARISEGRREEMGRLLAWARARGYFVRMVTLTCRHGKADKLADLMLRLKGRTKNKAKGIKAYSGAKQRLVQHRRYKDHVRSHIIGSVTATEVTGGGRHGWHPHMHMILILDEDIDFTPMRDAWLSALQGVGLDGTGDGWDVREADETGRYLAKWGAAEELALAGRKRGRGTGRTPAQLLAASCDEADREAGELWAEYATVFHGRRQLVWSPGLQKLVGIKDRKDKDLARDDRQDDQTETGRANISHPVWSGRIASRGLDRRADLLDRAEQIGAPQAVAEVEAQVRPDKIIKGPTMPRPPMPPDGLAARAAAAIRQKPVLDIISRDEVAPAVDGAMGMPRPWAGGSSAFRKKAHSP